MNEEEFWPMKFLKVKYSRGDQIIQLFFRTGSSQEIKLPQFK